MTGHLNGALRFWDLTGTTLREHQPISPNLSKWRVVSLPGRIGTQSEGAEAIWVAPSGTALNSTLLTSETVERRWPLFISRDQSRLVTGAPGGMAIVHEERDGVWQPIRGVNAGAGYMVCAALNADHSRLVTGTTAGNLDFWDLTTPRLTRIAHLEFLVGNQYPNQLAFAADDSLLIARIGTNVKVFRVSDQSLEELPVPDFNGIQQLHDFDISPDGWELATKAHGRADRWSLSDSEVRHVERIRQHGTSVSYAPDGRRLALITGEAGDTPTLVIRNLVDGFDEQSIALPGDAKVKYLDDSRHILTVNANGTLYILRP
jgi:WD40 repeat protein